MAITPKIKGDVLPPNDLPAQDAGEITTPNNLPAQPSQDITTPNTLTSEAEGQVATPNTLTSEAEGQVATPNTLTSEAEGAVTTPNDIPSQPPQAVLPPNALAPEAPKAIPRTLTPMVSLDFAHDTYSQGRNTQRLEDITDFTRGSTATFINRKKNNLGQWEYFVDTAQPDELRFEYDPKTGESLGVLLEGGSTNLLLHSNDTTQTAWIKAQVTTELTSEVAAPDGVSQVNKITAIGGAIGHIVTQNIAASTAGDHTLTVYAKAGTETIFGVSVNQYSPTVTGSQCDVNLLTGEFFNVTGNAPTIKKLSNGWLAISVSFDIAIDSVQGSYFVGGLGNPDTSGYLYTAFAQVERLPFATAYIPTTSAAVTRADDRLIVPLSFSVSDNHTMFSDLSAIDGYENVTGNNAIIAAKMVGNTNGFQLSWASFSGNPSFILNYLAGGQQSITFPDAKYGKVCSTFDGERSKGYANGVQVMDRVVGAFDFINAEAFYFGIEAGGNKSRFQGHYKKFQFYNVTLTPDEIAKL